MMAETVTPDIFNPPCHELSNTIKHELDTHHHEALSMGEGGN